MKLIEAVLAYIAAEEMSGQELPYDLALALVKVKAQTREDFEFHQKCERDLIMKYAAADDNGNIKMASAVAFEFADASLSGEYESKRLELINMYVDDPPKRFGVKAPESIKPGHLEALSLFIAFINKEEL